MQNTIEKTIFVIAGPNGSGKTTFATEFLPNEADCPSFVHVYRDLVDEWAVYDSSGEEPKLLEEMSQI